MTAYKGVKERSHNVEDKSIDPDESRYQSKSLSSTLYSAHQGPIHSTHRRLNSPPWPSKSPRVDAYSPECLVVSEHFPKGHSLWQTQFLRSLVFALGQQDLGTATFAGENTRMRVGKGFDQVR
jgi:hypothetical protein